MTIKARLEKLEKKKKNPIGDELKPKDIDVIIVNANGEKFKTIEYRFLNGVWTDNDN